MGRIGLPLAFAFLAGCAGLPANDDRTESRAPVIAADATAFGRSVVAATPAGAAQHHLSGVRLLGQVASAYGSRIALIDGAEKTLDLQYYSIHYDSSTEALLDHLTAAARRGVRVRVLVDDFNTGGPNARVLRLDETPGISVRVFNPITGPRLWQAGRLIGSLFDFDRIQQRMHNKALIADNTLAVAGGRNLGNAYFGQAEKSNFLDLDVLLAGPIVPELSRSFDRYWNDILAYPAATIWPPRDRPVRKSDATAPPFDAPAPPPVPIPIADANPAQEARPETAADIGTDTHAPAVQARQVPGTEPMEASIRRGKFDLTWAPAILLADKPSKIDPEFDPAQESSGTAATEPAVPPGSNAGVASSSEPEPKPASQPNEEVSTAARTVLAGLPPDAAAIRTADADNGGPTVVDGLISLIGQARGDLLIVSPYFVPGEKMMEAFAQVRARRVRVRVVTNSLASNDAPLAHVGYARYRKALLALGVELYELKARGDVDLRFLGSAPQSRNSLHAKAMVRDSSLMVVGSMNLDLRSQLQNTEVGIVVRSRALARQLTQETEKTIGSCYRVGLGPDGELQWHPPANDTADAGEVLTHEPGASLGLLMMIKLIGPLAPETML